MKSSPEPIPEETGALDFLFLVPGRVFYAKLGKWHRREGTRKRRGEEKGRGGCLDMGLALRRDLVAVW